MSQDPATPAAPCDCPSQNLLNDQNILYLSIAGGIWGVLLLVLIFAWLCGYCKSKPSSIDDGRDVEKDVQRSGRLPKKTASQESTGADYYSQIMQNSPKVKSISQYMNKDKSNRINSAVVKSQVEKRAKVAPKKAASHESTGSGYYDQLMSKDIKVKSISQYGAKKK